MQYTENSSDAGELYIVRNPRGKGGGKTVVRRPHAPPTSAPLDDDFDAYTVDTGWVPNDAPDEELPQDSGTDILPPARSSSYIDAPREATDRRARGHIRRMSSLSGIDEDLARLKSPSAAHIEEQYTGSSSKRTLTSRPRGNSGASSARPPVEKQRPSPPSDTGSARRVKTTRGLDLVERKVLEDGPERTVTVWREEVARTRSNSELSRKPTRSGSSKAKELSRRAYDGGGRDDVSIYYQGYHGGLHPDPSDVFDEFGRAVGGGESPGAGNRKGKDKLLQGGAESESIGRYDLERAIAKSPSKRNPTTNRTHLETSQLSPRPAHSNHSQSAPSLATRTSTRTPTSTRAHARADLSLERILVTSTQPPLAHLGSTLAEIGIRSADHLRAIAKMRGEREGGGDGYREVREEALRCGITVVEWAILLDSVAE